MDELELIDQEIAALKSRRADILVARMKKIAADPRLRLLVSKLDTRPTLTRLEIGELFPDLSYEDAKVLIVRAKNNGLIKNVGTRRTPRWVLTAAALKKENVWNGTGTTTRTSRSKQRS